MARLGYLFPAFPVFHQTFVLWEVLGLKCNGVAPKIYSLRRGSARQQPEGEEIAREVTYLPSLWSMPVWESNWRRLRADYRGYLRLYGKVVKAWRRDAVTPEQDGSAKRPGATLYNRARGWLNGHPFPYLLKSLALVPMAVYLAERLEQDGITHLHVHWATYPATVAYIVHCASGLPLSISAHAYDIYMIQRMLRAKVRAARFVVTCAKTNARFLQRVVGAELSNKIIVNYHGVDVSRFTPAPAKIGPAGRLTIVSCGQLERYKGMHLLIDACAELQRQGIVVDCSIVGEGPERAALERQVERLGLAAQVHLLGARPHAELVDLLRGADVFALASELAGRSRRRDVIANVIVEAMAAGLPVVASHIPGVEELIEDGVTGYLVPPNRTEDFAAAIRELVDHPEDRVRFGHAARRRVLQDFDSSKNVRQLAGLLRAASEGAVEAHRQVAARGT